METIVTECREVHWLIELRQMCSSVRGTMLYRHINKTFIVFIVLQSLMFPKVKTFFVLLPQNVGRDFGVKLCVTSFDLISRCLFWQELSQLRVAKVTGGAAAKLSKM